MIYLGEKVEQKISLVGCYSSIICIGEINTIKQYLILLNFRVLGELLQGSWHTVTCGTLTVICIEHFARL